MQLKLDFSQPKQFLEDEKKTELISFRVGLKFREDLEAIRRVKKIDSTSELCLEYVIKGFIEDYKNCLLMDVNGKKSLRDLLRG